MDTPFSSKRAHDGALSVEPTRKVLRVEEARAVQSAEEEPRALESILERLHDDVNAFKAVDPSSITAAQLKSVTKALDALGKAVDLVEEQHEAIRNPPPEETPVPFDHLVHSLTFLSPHDLAQAAQVSRHFAKAAPAAVQARLDKLASDSCGAPSYFQIDYGESYCAEFLHRIEEEHENAPKLIAKLIKSKSSHSENAAVIQALKLVHSEVLYLHVDKIAEKLEHFQQDDGESSDESDDSDAGSEGEREDFWVRQRADLMWLLHLSNMPEDELPDYVHLMVHEMAVTDYPSFGIFCPMLRMPVDKIVEHIDLILKSLRNADVDDLLAADYALQCVDRLPVATRKQVGGLRAALEQLAKTCSILPAVKDRVTLLKRARRMMQEIA